MLEGPCGQGHRTGGGIGGGAEGGGSAEATGGDGEGVVEREAAAVQLGFYRSVVVLTVEQLAQGAVEELTRLARLEQVAGDGEIRRSAMAGPEEETAEGIVQRLDGTIGAARGRLAMAEGLAQGLGIDGGEGPLATEDRVDFSRDQDEVGMAPEAGGAGFIKPQADATAEQPPAGAVVITTEQDSGKEGPLVVEHRPVGGPISRGCGAGGGGKQSEVSGEVVAGGDDGLELVSRQPSGIGGGRGIDGLHGQASTGPYWASAAPG